MTDFNTKTNSIRKQTKNDSRFAFRSNWSLSQQDVGDTENTKFKFEIIVNNNLTYRALSQGSNTTSVRKLGYERKGKERESTKDGSFVSEDKIQDKIEYSPHNAIIALTLGDRSQVTTFVKERIV